MNIGEAFFKLGEHPPSFVSLLNLLLLPFSLCSFHLLYFGLIFKTRLFYRWKEHVSVNMITKYYFSICWRYNSYAVPSSLLAKMQNASSVFLLQSSSECKEAKETERNGITFFWTTITEISHKTTLILMIMWKICLLFPRLNGVLPTSHWSVAPSSVSFHDLCLPYFLFCTLLLVEIFT